MDPEQQRTVTYLLSIGRAVAIESNANGPYPSDIEYVGETLVLTYQTHLRSGGVSTMSYEVDSSGRCRLLVPASERGRYERYGRRFKKAHRGLYTELRGDTDGEGWNSRPSDDALTRAERDVQRALRRAERRRK